MGILHLKLKANTNNEEILSSHVFKFDDASSKHNEYLLVSSPLL